MFTGLGFRVFRGFLLRDLRFNPNPPVPYIVGIWGVRARFRA